MTNFKLDIIKSADGSHTLYREDIDETYHSTHGAINEALHVFIQNGLLRVDKTSIDVFEVGFGTGLNALSTLAQQQKDGVEVNYTGLEAFPISKELADQVNYCDFEPFKELKGDFIKLHEVEWGRAQKITSGFYLTKIEDSLQSYKPEQQFDIIFYDAFGPRAQGEMWEKEVLEKAVNLLKDGGVFVTYCAKGQVRRDLISLGVEMKRIPGPPGKREMLFGKKNG